MEAVEFEGVDLRIAEDQPEYNTLPAKIVDVPLDMSPNSPTVPGLIFCMKLSPEELAEVNRTGVIWHTVLTFGQPLQPQLMTAERPAFAQ